jgi:hypothetical protein
MRLELALNEMKSRVGTEKLVAVVHFVMWRIEIQFQLKLVLRNTPSDASLNKN